jgi:hypothetical protein
MARKPCDGTRRNNGFAGESRHTSPNDETTTSLPAPLVHELSALLTRILVADIQAFPVGSLVRGGLAHGTKEQEHDSQ